MEGFGLFVASVVGLVLIAAMFIWIFGEKRMDSAVALASAAFFFGLIPLGWAAWLFDFPNDLALALAVLIVGGAFLLGLLGRES